MGFGLRLGLGEAGLRLGLGVEVSVGVEGGGQGREWRRGRHRGLRWGE